MSHPDISIKASFDDVHKGEYFGIHIALASASDLLSVPDLPGATEHRCGALQALVSAHSCRCPSFQSSRSIHGCDLPEQPGTVGFVRRDFFASWMNAISADLTPCFTSFDLMSAYTFSNSGSSSSVSRAIISSPSSLSFTTTLSLCGLGVPRSQNTSCADLRRLVRW